MEHRVITVEDGNTLDWSSIGKMEHFMVLNKIDLKYSVYIIQLFKGNGFSSPNEPMAISYTAKPFNWYTAIKEDSLSIINLYTNKIEIWNLKNLLKDIWNGKYKFM